ncbi:MAG: PilC/PilY family type IV pilus protein [Myxococcota bacterium]|nr:PilC/PilY family type IV pilus protein [Myxococcota bacterium]
MKTLNRPSIAAVVTLALLYAPVAQGQSTDDTALFSVAVPPNVMLLVDNSGSMNHLVWHPEFDPAVTYSCNEGNGGWTGTQYWTSNQTRTQCGAERTFYVDPAVTADGNSTRFDHRYLNWIHSLNPGDTDDAEILAELAATGNGTYSSCLQAYGFTTFNRYRRARVSAAKDVLREVICNVNAAGEVRFGIAQYRRSGGDGDPNGGFVRVPIKDFDTTTYTLNGSTRTHLGHLAAAIDALEGETWTPLAESLFQVYTYFMSRDSSDRPEGVNGNTFPAYTYRTDVTGNYGARTSTASEIPEAPVQYECQKNFVVLITDGEPTKDDFDNSNSSDNTALGFSDFDGLIGDYHADGETEVDPAWASSGWESTQYLDDVAKFMQDTDFRLDFDERQVIDVYTVGFNTTADANAILRKTAEVGNGLFFYSTNAEELATAIVETITDIIRKAQSFTAATVPATRTADGGSFYTSLFLPRDDSPYWEGHLKLFQITADGDILDKNDNCALLDPQPAGECKSGAIDPSAEPFWDAGEEIPSPATRRLYTSFPLLGRIDFDTNLGVVHLGDLIDFTDDLTLGDRASYSGSNATTAEELADEIIQNVRGCEFGTGVTNACETREWLLGDIFHSNPLVVGPPRGFLGEASYSQFKADHATRDKVIYAGANDGFLHAFLAGEWDSLASPPAYDHGTGEELFGFMPWPARQAIRELPKDVGNRDHYFVDGSPAAADVWFYSSATQATKALDGSEWRTVLIGGLRQGGAAYYALDVTDPDSASYPDYLWEFPGEVSGVALRDYFGETWGRPIITKVRVDISGTPYERWVAVVTAGYDPSSDPNDAVNYDPSSTKGRGIFLIDIKTGEVLAEKKFDPTAPVGDLQREMLYSIATTPAVYDLDADGFADVIFFGDLGGNMWKWVVRYEPASGNVGTDPINSTGDVSQPGWRFTRFFQATPTLADPLGVTIDAETYYKSFFHPPAATLKSGKLWLAFGSGERANLKREGDDSTEAENNRFYSVTDLDPYERNPVGNPTLSEADLFDASNNGSCLSLVGYRGYFFVGEDGEKWVTNVGLFAFYVIAASFTPEDTADPCAAGGSATLYVFRIYCGEGYFPNPGQESRRLELGPGMPTDPKVSVSPEGTRVIITQQDGEIENPPGPPQEGSGLGQMYWREVNQ